MNQLFDPEILSTLETTRLAALETTIDAGMQTFVDVGSALLEIRDSRLYRQEFATFEDYCRERWGMSRSYAHRMIDAATVTENLLPIGNIPATESQARPLTSLAPDQQREAWQRAIDTAPNGKVTAAHVQSVVDEMRPAPAPVSDWVQAPTVRYWTPEEDKPADEPKAYGFDVPVFVPPVAPVPIKPVPEWTPSELERRHLVETGMTVHANMKSDYALIEWAKGAGLFVRIDRATEWGNPFLLPEDGDRQTVVENYQWYLDNKPSLLAKLPTLKGKVLGCWCYPEMCHGKVLEEYADDRAD